MTPDGDEQLVSQPVVRGFLLGEIAHAPIAIERQRKRNRVRRMDAPPMAGSGAVEYQKTTGSEPALTAMACGARGR